MSLTWDEDANTVVDINCGTTVHSSDSAHPGLRGLGLPPEPSSGLSITAFARLLALSGPAMASTPHTWPLCTKEEIKLPPDSLE